MTGRHGHANAMDSAFAFTIERDSGPIHAAIARQVVAAIDSGRLAPGMRLPPERELATTLGVSRMTVRQALGELERDGRLRRVVGRTGGTFVRDPTEAPATSSTGTLSAELRRRGGATSVDVVSAVVEPPGRRVAGALEVERDDRIVAVTRLHLAAGKPLSVERSALPARLFPDLEELDLSGSLVGLMASVFAVRVARSVERLALTEARPQDARSLGVRRQSPLLLVERIRYATDGLPVEFARERFRPDRTHIVMESRAVGG